MVVGELKIHSEEKVKSLILVTEIYSKCINILNTKTKL